MPITYGTVEFPLKCEATVIYDSGREVTNLIYCYEMEKDRILFLIRDYNIEKVDNDLLRELVSNAAPPGSRGEVETE